MKASKFARAATTLAVALGGVALDSGAAGASTDPIPFSWVFVNTDVGAGSPPINLHLPPCCGSSYWGSLGGGASLFVGPQTVYGNPPGVSSSYTSFGIRLPL